MKSEVYNLFRIVLIGPSEAGKTSLNNSWAQGTFNKNEFLPTIGIDCQIKIIEHQNEKNKLLIWDTAGNYAYAQMNSSNIKSSKAQIIVFDLTDFKSFSAVPYHLNCKHIHILVVIRDLVQPENQRIYLFGNKSDLYENRKITFDEAEQFAISEGIQYLETSATDFEGINEIFTNISNELSKCQASQKYEQQKQVTPPIQQVQQKQLSQAAPSNWQLRIVQKIVLIGDERAGKSSFLSRILNNQFPEYYIPTVGIEFGQKLLNIYDKSVKLEIWDSSGNPKYQKITESYFKGAYSFILLYDITERQQFNNLQNWMQSESYIFKRELQHKDCIHKPVYLIGNKTDLHLKRTVAYDEGKEMADTQNWRFCETSCKDGDNIESIVKDLASNLFE